MIWKFFKGSETKAGAIKPAKGRAPLSKPGAVSSNLGGATNPAPGETPPSYDPYNSGAFDKRGAWNKVIRK